MSKSWKSLVIVATLAACCTTVSAQQTLPKAPAQDADAEEEAFDEELRALRFVDARRATIATLVNWNTHPESLEAENTFGSNP